MSASEEYPEQRRNKGALAVCLLVGAICLVVGGVCGGTFMAVFYVLPAQLSVQQQAEVETLRAQATRQAMLARAAQQANQAQMEAALAAAADSQMLSGGESEKDARSFFENLRAGRAEALRAAATPSLANRQPAADWEQVVAKYPMAARTKPIGDELAALPPIDEMTHQYVFKTATRDGQPVQFTVTMVKQLYGSLWQVDQFIAEELAAESDDHGSH